MRHAVLRADAGGKAASAHVPTESDDQSNQEIRAERRQSSDRTDQQPNFVRFANIKARYCRRMRVVLIGGINDAKETASGFELDDFKGDEFRLFCGTWLRSRLSLLNGHSSDQIRKAPIG